MSKKGTDTPASIRIRENQRRSRNQRKELIQDLQRRVQDYELKGIAATQDMQRAARKVAEENTRLRSLLASHGVAHEEVEAYLRSFDVASVQHHTSFGTPTSYASPVSRHNGTPEIEPGPMRYPTQPWTQPQAPVQPSVTALRPSRTSQPEPIPHVSQPPAQPLCRPQAQAYAQSPAQGCCPVPTSQTMNQYPAPEQQEQDIPMRTSPEPSPPTKPESPEFSRPARSSSQTQYQNDDYMDDQSTYPTPQDDNTQVFPIVHVEEDVDCPNTSSCFCPPTTRIKERPLDTGLLISCETAATIIAEMRGDGDRHRIRASLGCHGDKECNVKNSVVLELMDER